MKLHFRGIQVPSLGSTRDIVYRGYLLHEAKTEAKRHELDLLIALSNPAITESQRQREWGKQVKNTFDEYVLLLLGQSSLPVNQEEQQLQKFYSEVVKNSSPKLIRGKDGKLKVEDIPKI